MINPARNAAQLGSIIRRARKSLGWSQTKLGDRVGLGQDTISLLETGNSAAKLGTVLAVLGALDLEIRIAPRTKGSAADIEQLF